MPRESAASLEVVQIEEHLPRIEPPAHLSHDEKTLFRAIVKECHPQHFVKSDAELLTAYVQSCLLLSVAFAAAMKSPDHLPSWERCARTMASLSTKLRLAPNARCDPISLTRRTLGLSRRELSPSLEGISQVREGNRGWKPRHPA